MNHPPAKPAVATIAVAFRPSRSITATATTDSTPTRTNGSSNTTTATIPGRLSTVPVRGLGAGDSGMVFAVDTRTGYPPGGCPKREPRPWPAIPPRRPDHLGRTRRFRRLRSITSAERPFDDRQRGHMTAHPSKPWHQPAPWSTRLLTAPTFRSSRAHRPSCDTVLISLGGSPKGLHPFQVGGYNVTYGRSVIDLTPDRQPR